MRWAYRSAIGARTMSEPGGTISSSCRVKQPLKSSRAEARGTSCACPNALILVPPLTAASVRKPSAAAALTMARTLRARPSSCWPRALSNTLFCWCSVGFQRPHRQQREQQYPHVQTPQHVAHELVRVVYQHNHLVRDEQARQRERHSEARSAAAHPEQEHEVTDEGPGGAAPQGELQAAREGRLLVDDGDIAQWRERRVGMQ